MPTSRISMSPTNATLNTRDQALVEVESSMGATSTSRSIHCGFTAVTAAAIAAPSECPSSTTGRGKPGPVDQYDRCPADEAVAAVVREAFG